MSGPIDIALETARGFQSEPSSQSPVEDPTKSDEKGYLLDESNAGESRPAGFNAPPHDEFSEKAHLGGSTDDSQEWEIVSIPDEGEDDAGPPTNRIEGHFVFTVGWGQRKLTLVSCDLRYESQKGDK
ncbi:hypothetical protein EKO27_g2034 [Xylaria grammica]|uniref:Uncharacterized protein n=1 Tax=Xylaria grammica TaxID=363999 RepID=A0A439DF95_9PEZI|nr:hypothetical protein EKO27_g2034 [Xylaria grammica]